MKSVVALVVLLLAGCSSSTSSDPESEPAPARSWLAMEPEDVRTFDGSGGELMLIFVDETYDIDGAYASALTWKLGDDYTTDYFVEDDDGTVWWYGRKGSWRAGRHGAEPREVAVIDHRARFGDITVTLSEDGPVQVETPDGVYTSS